MHDSFSHIDLFSPLSSTPYAHSPNDMPTFSNGFIPNIHQPVPLMLQSSIHSDPPHSPKLTAYVRPPSLSLFFFFFSFFFTFCTLTRRQIKILFCFCYCPLIYFSRKFFFVHHLYPLCPCSAIPFLSSLSSTSVPPRFISLFVLLLPFPTFPLIIRWQLIFRIVILFFIFFIFSRIALFSVFSDLNTYLSDRQTLLFFSYFRLILFYYYLLSTHLGSNYSWSYFICCYV
eukprot:TRINITY_DN7088_c0_g1::TRINITY_DN7088_c0_g1_i1::g.19896::m.19896 TRINITY_DN7088_c0_g1::TRINITY_DN7088_c0_g1_i1::g.19896  ORF type:complete len:229 (-),score=-32.12,PAP2/PF01569.16/0.085,PAP2/PF01569.16/3.1e+02 TRINITY_DN7088_c0_g1_i1:455-1141(-)